MRERGALTTQDVAFALVRPSVLVEDVMVCKTAPWHATAPQTQASYSAAGPYIDLTRCPWGIAAGRQRGGPGGIGPPGPPACAQPASAYDRRVLPGLKEDCRYRSRADTRVAINWCRCARVGRRRLGRTPHHPAIGR